jgi:folate-binding protein YgfZ
MMIVPSYLTEADGSGKWGKMGSCVLPDRAVLAVSGAEAGAFLDNVITVNVSGLPLHGARFGALLTPQGKIIVDFFVIRIGDGFLIDCPRALAADLLKKLTLYRLRAKVTMTDVSEAYHIVALWNEPVPDKGIAFIDPRLAALGSRIISPRDEARTVSSDVTAYDQHRIMCGVSQGGRDFIYGDAFPHEALMDCLHGVDFKKGCYIGQEVVSRMEHRSTARTRCVPVIFKDNVAPPEGTEAFAGERLIGVIGSVASDGHALARLRLDRVAEAQKAGEALHAGGLAFQVETRDFMNFTLNDFIESPSHG